eukprot:scaffold1809_cov386-Prasinococcus_capsulatus_cf.AAC.11
MSVMLLDHLRRPVPWTGLSFPDDPISIVFNYACPRILGDASYAQYVLQFIAYRLWPVAVIKDPSFFLFLMAASLYAVVFIQQPIQRRWTKHPKYMPLILPLTLMSVVLAMDAAHRPANGVTRATIGGIAEGDVGDELIYDEAMKTYDYLLDWQLPQDLSDHKVINPSILADQQSNSLLIAGRAHRIRTYETTGVRWNGSTVTELVSEWSSKMVVATVSSSDLSANPPRSTWLQDSNTTLLRELKITSDLQLPSQPMWAPLCQPPPTYFASNNTLFRTVVTGPEDPKLIKIPGGGNRIGVTFNSLPPPSLAAGQHNDQCNETADGVSQMFLTYYDDLQGFEDGSLTAGVRLTCSRTRIPEKNWIAFEYDVCKQRQPSAND